MNPTWQVIVPLASVVITAIFGPWFVSRVAKREASRLRAEDNERRALSAESSQIHQLFSEQTAMREQYRQDIDDLRARLSASEALRERQGQRISALELEVAEWRGGTRGVAGVWVAVPSSVWTYVRDRMPELPKTSFPGEHDEDLPPAVI